MSCKVLLAELERLTDSTSMRHILDVLAEMCCEKGIHLRENWQDKIQAREWERIAKRLDAIDPKV